MVLGGTARSGVGAAYALVWSGVAVADLHRPLSRPHEDERTQMRINFAGKAILTSALALAFVGTLGVLT